MRFLALLVAVLAAAGCGGTEEAAPEDRERGCLVTQEGLDVFGPAGRIGSTEPIRIAEGSYAEVGDWYYHPLMSSDPDQCAAGDVNLGHRICEMTEAGRAARETLPDSQTVGAHWSDRQLDSGDWYTMWRLIAFNAVGIDRDSCLEGDPVIGEARIVEILRDRVS